MKKTPDKESNILTMNKWLKIPSEDLESKYTETTHNLGEKFTLRSTSPTEVSIFYENYEIPLKIIPGGSFSMGFSTSEESVLLDTKFRQTKFYYQPVIEQFLEHKERMRPVREVIVPAFLISEIPITETMLQELGVECSPGDCDSLGWWDSAYILPEVIDELVSEVPFRLPSEAEWEFVYRSGSQALFFWGDDPSLASKMNNNHPLGIKEMGFHWELCADQWHPSYKGAPSNPNPWIEGGDSKKRVVRGGAGLQSPWQDCGEWIAMVSAYRDFLDLTLEESFQKLVSFRLCLDLTG